jgi:hypothetical protein
MKKLLVIIGLVFLLAACGVQPAPKDIPENLETSAGSWQLIGKTEDLIHSIKLNDLGNPLLGVSRGYDAYVEYWNGNAWVQLGAALDTNINQTADAVQTALDKNNNLIASFHECVTPASDGNYCLNNNIYVKRWTGANWLQLGSALDIKVGQSAQHPSIDIDAKGNPVVSWWEIGNDIGDKSDNIYVKRWNGSTWVQLGGSLDISSNTHADSPSLVLDDSGNPIVIWTEAGNIYVKRWNGSSWIQLGDALDVNSDEFAYHANIVLDKTGAPIVSWNEVYTAKQAYQVYVKRWNGSSWIQLGNALNVDTTQDGFVPSLILDKLGNPIVGWVEIKSLFPNARDEKRLYVKGWNGSSWNLLGSTLNTFLEAGGILLASDDLGNIVAGFGESDGVSAYSYVKKYNPSTDPWTFLGDSALTTSSSTIDANIALRGNDRPVVAWSSYDTDRSKSTLNLKEWNGASWVSVASLGNLPTTTFAMATRSKANSTDMSIDPIGFSWKSETATQFTISVKIRNLNSWQTIAPLIKTKTLSGSPISDYRLALDKSGAPIIAWLIRDTDPYYSVYVAKWNGSAWVQLGGVAALRSGNFGYGESIDLEIDPLNRPVVATLRYVSRWNGYVWVKLGDGGASWSPQIAFIGNEPVISSVVPKSSSSSRDPASVTVSRWNGSSWVGMGILDVTSDKPAGNPYISVDSLSRPIVTWYEQDGTSYNIYVKRWNGTAWTLFGNRLDKVLSNKVLPLDVFNKSNNQVIVSWFEAGNIYFKQR